MAASWFVERWVSAPVNGSRTGVGVESDWAMGCSVAWLALAGLLVRQTEIITVTKWHWCQYKKYL